MYTVTQTEITCLTIAVSDARQMTKDSIKNLAKSLTLEAEKLIGQNKLFYLCCNGVNYFPWPMRKDSYISLYGAIEHFIYKMFTTEGDAFISLLKNQVYPAQWICTILLRELYVAVVMQNYQLSKANHHELIEIINNKLRTYDEAKNIYGALGSPIEDSTAKTLLDVYAYIREGNQLNKSYLAGKVS